MISLDGYVDDWQGTPVGLLDPQWDSPKGATDINALYFAQDETSFDYEKLISLTVLSQVSTQAQVIEIAVSNSYLNQYTVDFFTHFLITVILGTIESKNSM